MNEKTFKFSNRDIKFLMQIQQNNYKCISIKDLDCDICPIENYSKLVKLPFIQRICHEYVKEDFEYLIEKLIIQSKIKKLKFKYVLRKVN